MEKIWEKRQADDFFNNVGAELMKGKCLSYSVSGVLFLVVYGKELQIIWN